MTEERRRQILEDLRREREIRRKKAQDINMCQPYTKLPEQKDNLRPESDEIIPPEEKPLEMLINVNTEDFKDPHDILMAPDDTQEEYDFPSKINETRERYWNKDHPKDTTTSISPIKNNNNKIFDTNLMKECLEVSTHSVRYMI